MGTLCGVSVCDLEGKFKYHGTTYKIYVSKLWTQDDRLVLEYRGIYGVQDRDKR